MFKGTAPAQECGCYGQIGRINYSYLQTPEFDAAFDHKREELAADDSAQDKEYRDHQGL